MSLLLAAAGGGSAPNLIADQFRDGARDARDLVMR